MALQDPVAVYDAASNFEAHLICQFLRDAGIDAAVVEDLSPGGLFSLGTLDGIHKPQVWVERSAVEAAQALIWEYEDRQDATEQPADPAQYCYLCGEAIAADAHRCAACGGYLEPPEDTQHAPDYEPNENPYASSHAPRDVVSGFDTLRSLKKPIALLWLTFIAGGFLMTIISLALYMLEDW